jgi:hypothetical protein
VSVKVKVRGSCPYCVTVIENRGENVELKEEEEEVFFGGNAKRCVCDASACLLTCLPKI